MPTIIIVLQASRVPRPLDVGAGVPCACGLDVLVRDCALLEQRPLQLHRVADSDEAVLAAAAAAGPIAVTLDRGIAR